MLKIKSSISTCSPVAVLTAAPSIIPSTLVKSKLIHESGVTSIKFSASHLISLLTSVYTSAVTSDLSNSEAMKFVSESTNMIMTSLNNTGKPTSMSVPRLFKSPITLTSNETV